jgi:hypothetical protein
MPFPVTPLVGAQPTELNAINGKTFALGNTFTADDGHVYIYAKASGAIAAGATAILTEPAMTMASGAGAWTNATGSALVANDQCWFKKTAI